MGKSDNSSTKRWGIIVSLAAIVVVCIAAIALIPAFGQWLFPGMWLPNQDMTQPSTGSVTGTPILSAEPQSVIGNVLLTDDFSSKRWGTATDKDSSIEYTNGVLQVIVYTKNHFVLSTPNEKDFQNIHMEVTVNNNGTDSTTAFGIVCNKQPSTSNFYYLAMTPAGEYAIAKAVDGQSDVFLTNNNSWASSNAIKQNAAFYRVGADCGNGTLTLYVDGQQIASVSDSSYTLGGIALFVWSGENATTTNISFDDFLMTQFP